MKNHQFNKKIISYMMIFMLAFIPILGILEQNGLISASALSINKSTLKMNVGEKQTLSIKDSSGTVKWSSSNPKVASVNQLGEVTALASGVSNITVISNGKSQFCYIIVKQPVTEVIYPEKEISLDVGTSEQYIPLVLPLSATNKALTYKSASSNIAIVNNFTGTIGATSVGTTEISAISQDGNFIQGKLKVKTNPSLKSFVIKGKGSMIIGESQIVEKSFIPNDFSCKVSYTSSNPSVATVDSNGKIIAKTAGTTMITGTPEKNPIMKSMLLVTVKKPEITDIKITGNNTLTVDDAVQLSATLTPSNIISTPSNTTWKSSNTSLATITNDGVVDALKSGTVKVTATSGDVTDSIDIIISDKVTPAKSVTINGPETVYVGRPTNFSAIVSPANASQSVLWSSNSSGVTIDEHGVVSGKYAVNGAVITAKTSNNKIATKTINVVPIVTDMKIVGTEKISVGSSKTFDIQVTPKSATNNVVLTSSDTSIATVDESWNVTGKKNGTVTLTATAQDPVGMTKTFELIVGSGNSSSDSNNYIKSMVIGGTDGNNISSLIIGDKKTISCNPTFNGSNQSIPVTWNSSDTSILSITPNGYQANIEAKKPGTVTLTATSTDSYKCQATKTVTITSPVVQTLQLSASKTDLNVGETIQINKNVTPTSASNNVFTWRTTNTNVATVDQNGKVTAVGKETGVVYVTCISSNGITAQLKLNIANRVSTTSFSVPNNNLTVGNGTQISFSFSNPSFATYRFKSSNTNVATVTSKGYISGVGTGHVIISLESTDGTILTGTTSLELDVNEKEIITVTVDKGTIMTGDTAKATQTGSLTSGTWSSTNPNVATIDQSGNIKAIASGTTNIRYQTATSGAGVNITVTAKQNISYLSISAPTDKVAIGNTIQFSKTVSPSNLSDYTNWTSSNNGIASINENGLLTANGVGTVTITLSSTDGSNKSTSVVIYVNDGDKFTSVTANDNLIKYMYVGETIRLLNSRSATDQGCTTFTYESSDPNIASVDNVGNITVKRVGKVTISQKATTGAIYRENIEIINPSGNYFRPYLNNVSINRGANCDFLLLGNNTNLSFSTNDKALVGGSTAYSSDYNFAFAARNVGTDTITVVNTDGYATSFKVNILDSLNTSGISGMEFDANMSKQIMDGINEYRGQSGVRQLTFYQFAQDIAKAQALSQHRMASYAPDGYNYDYSMHNSIQISAYYWGYTPDASEVIQDWKDSSGHNASMLRSTDEVIGVAAYKTPYGYGVYVTKQTKSAVDSPFNW